MRRRASRAGSGFSDRGFADWRGEGGFVKKMVGSSPSRPVDRDLRARFPKHIKRSRPIFRQIAHVFLVRNKRSCYMAGQHGARRNKHSEAWKESSPFRVAFAAGKTAAGGDSVCDVFRRNPRTNQWNHRWPHLVDYEQSSHHHRIQRHWRRGKYPSHDQ